MPVEVVDVNGADVTVVVVLLIGLVVVLVVLLVTGLVDEVKLVVVELVEGRAAKVAPRPR